MAQAPVAGTSSFISFGWESTFNSAVTCDKAFSQGVRLPTYDIDNDPEFIYALGNQDLQAQIAKTFKGTWGVEFIYSDCWWIRGIMGAAPTKAGGGPYTYTWTVANSGISNTQNSMSLNFGVDFITTDSNQVLTGCIANSMTMTFAVSEPIRVRLEGWYAGITKGTVLVSAATVGEQPMVFSQATLQFPSGNTVLDVQSVELSFNRNNDPIYALGSRFPQANVPKQREWSIRVSSTYELDSDFWDHLLGSTTVPTATVAEVADLILTLTNGLGTTYTRSLVFTFANCFVHRGSLPASPEDVLKTDLDIRARTLTSIVATNNTSAEP